MTLLKLPPPGQRYDGKPVRPVTAWSYSALAVFEECPQRFLACKILGYPDPPGPALLKGRKVHKEAEDFLKVPSAPIPKSIQQFERLATQLRTLNPYVELQITFRSDWSLGTKGWFGDDVWLRVAWDWAVHYEHDRHADLGDWKTGKRYDSNDEQLELFALTGMLKLRAQTVTTRLWYVESGLEIVGSFDAKDKGALLSKWTERANKMLHATSYPPRPNKNCGFCPVSSRKGGPCAEG